MRIGFSKDVHRLVRNRTLCLGGVNIPFKKGLLAHSDGDVVIHSLVDAIIGALNLGDIGKLFPDNDKKYENYNSIDFLDEMRSLLTKYKMYVEYIDIFISCEKPKLSDYTQIMKANIANKLNIEPSRISIKCGTNEKLGYVGKMKGIECFSTVLLMEEKDKHE